MKYRSLQLRLYPDSLLRTKAFPVEDIDASVRALMKAMTRLMRSYKGIGLAAPQAGIAQRVIVADLGEETLVLANPEVSEREGEDWLREGCLSLPNVQVDVRRPQSVFVRGIDRDGKEVERELRGLPARVIQHEIDHLNGVLIIDHGPAIITIEDKQHG
ncbi:MAG: peptide deformylase [Deltaproteobacteria bacterium]|nr:peptide deformylase [Deltaproteobacteria bacterium]